MAVVEVVSTRRQRCSACRRSYSVSVYTRTAWCAFCKTMTRPELDEWTGALVKAPTVCPAGRGCHRSFPPPACDGYVECRAELRARGSLR